MLKPGSNYLLSPRTNAGRRSMTKLVNWSSPGKWQVLCACVCVCNFTPATFKLSHLNFLPVSQLYGLLHDLVMFCHFFCKSTFQLATSFPFMFQSFSVSFMLLLLKQNQWYTILCQLSAESVHTVTHAGQRLPKIANFTKFSTLGVPILTHFPNQG